MNSIPVFAINLKKRTERKMHILKEFAHRDEFTLTIVEAQEHKFGFIGLWNTLKNILTSQLNSNHPYIIICEDDHQFTDGYTKERLLKCIQEAEQKKADILSGGVSWFDNALPVSDNLFWMEKFTGAQLTIL